MNLFGTSNQLFKNTPLAPDLHQVFRMPLYADYKVIVRVLQALRDVGIFLFSYELNTVSWQVDGLVMKCIHVADCGFENFGQP